MFGGVADAVEVELYSLFGLCGLHQPLSGMEEVEISGKLLLIPIPFLQEKVQTTFLNVASEAPTYISSLLPFLTVYSKI